MPYTEYGELEKEIIEKSIDRFERNQTIQRRNEEAGFDPRIIQAQAEISAQGFVMEEGKLVDLLK